MGRRVLQEPSHVLRAGKDGGLKAWLWAFAGKARAGFPVLWLNLPNLVALAVVPWLSGLRALGMVLLVAAWWGWPILVSRSARALWLINLPFAMLAWPAAV